jgi:hypothetical protein
MQSAQSEWLEEVKVEVSKWKDADAKKQQEICEWIDNAFGPEAAAMARQLFAEEASPKEKPKPQGDKVEVSFRGEQARADDEPPLLSKASPYDSAREFVRHYCFKEGVLAVYYWDGSFWGWNGRYYEKVSADKINADVWTFLDGARSGTGNDSSRFRPKPADVEGVRRR